MSYHSGSVSTTVNPNAVDLDVSRLSQGSYSSVSTVTLGGSQYPVGTTVGTSGLFVIGDPSGGSKKRSSSSQSVSTSYSIRGLVNSKGYVFEDWNWPVIRFSCFLVVIAAMVGLLAATIGLVLESKNSCYLEWDWWQGGVIYRIKVNEFYDNYLRDGVGDLSGIQTRVDYLTSLGITIISLSNFLPSFEPSFDQVIQFDGVDDRMGSPIELQNMINYLQSKGIRVILEMDWSHTSEGHSWFEESRRLSSMSNEVYTDFYLWKDIAPVQISFVDVLEFWLRKGVDGFHIHGVDQFFSQGGQPISDITLQKIVQTWRAMIDKYSKTSKKVLMLSDNILQRIKANSPHLLETILDTVNLIDYPFVVFGNNATKSLQVAIEQGGQWQGRKGRPWVSWRWSNMTKLAMNHWQSVELFLLMMPGTPSIIAGQEVGRDPDYINKNGRNRLISWASSRTDDDMKPYEKGSTLDVTTLVALTSCIKLRIDANTIRSNGEELLVDGETKKKKGYQILEMQDNVFLMERYFAQQDVYYYMANFGDARARRDWSSITASGLIEVDTWGQKGNIDFSQIVIEDGYSRVVQVPRWLHRRNTDDDYWK